MTFAAGLPFEPELNVSNVKFKMVPGEGFNSFRGPGVTNIDLNIARIAKINAGMSVKLLAAAKCSILQLKRNFKFFVDLRC